MTPVCVDLSHYQLGFDFRAFKAGGGLAVILKATEGTTIQDQSYKSFKASALDAGLKVASYHFFRPTDPSMQANYFYKFAAPVKGERLVCDWEDDNTSLGNVLAFLQRLKTLDPSLQLTVYGGAVIKQCLSVAANDWLTQNTSLWLSQYTSGTPSWPKQVWKKWSLWQYTDKAVVPGASAPVDGNKFNGSDERLLAWVGPTNGAPPLIPEVIPVRPPTMIPQPVNPIPVIAVIPTITIASDAPVKLRLGANITLET